MAVEAHTAIMRRWVEEGSNQGQRAVAAEVFAAGCVLHEPDGRALPAHGVPDEREYHIIAQQRRAFPDLAQTIDLLVADGDLVVVRWTSTETHQGTLRGIAPTGTQVTWRGVDIYRFAGGTVVEYWLHTDLLGLLRQLGVRPLHGPAAG